MSLQAKILSELGKVNDWTKDLHRDLQTLERSLAQLGTALDNYKADVRSDLRAMEDELGKLKVETGVRERAAAAMTESMAEMAAKWETLDVERRKAIDELRDRVLLLEQKQSVVFHPPRKRNGKAGAPKQAPMPESQS